MALLTFLLLTAPIEIDTLKHINIEDALIVASPKETMQLRKQALSVNTFSNEFITQQKVESLKDFSSFAPNFFMPDYGSRITSAVYIRGIGSRMNTPAVGLYVDNVPYIDKSAYDFSFRCIEHVDILRGPQGTLYGRNTMGGLVRIFTANPFSHSGTELSMGFSTRTLGRRASFTSFFHPSSNMALSLGGYYTGENGFYKNQTSGKKQDGSDAGGGRLRLAWCASDVVKLDLTASYEYSDEDACPYFFEKELSEDEDNLLSQQSEVSKLGKICQNRPSRYRRNLFNVGLGVEHRLQYLTLTSTTSYQHLNDRLFMDQDFTSLDLFSLEQRQYMHTLSEEIALKSSHSNNRWQWATGLFAMYQYLRTTCPVTFYGDGVSYLNNQINSSMPENMGINLLLTDETLPFNAQLITPLFNAALFHQSSIRLIKNLTLTLGLRLDYDYQELRLTSGTATPINYNFNMSMLSRLYPNGKDLTADPSFCGNHYHNSWQVLPKGAFNYELPNKLGNAYFSVTKGYRSGGYNIQSYSEQSQTALQRSIMLGVKDFSTTTISQMTLPDETKQKALDGMTSALEHYTPSAPQIRNLYYKPEYTWSYELGFHHSLIKKALQLDFCCFFMKTRNQQIARFSENGFGREMVNAGSSRSRGLEMSLQSFLFNNQLSISATYGYTHAIFTAYHLGTETSSSSVIDYTGNRVPYVPRHTFNIVANYTQPLKNNFVKSVAVGGNVKGAGDIVWDEANSFSQNFYATLDLRFCINMAKEISLELFARNLTATHYTTFAFDSMNRRFAQYGNPRHFGADITWKF